MVPSTRTQERCIFYIATLDTNYITVYTSFPFFFFSMGVIHNNTLIKRKTILYKVNVLSVYTHGYLHLNILPCNNHSARVPPHTKAQAYHNPVYYHQHVKRRSGNPPGASFLRFVFVTKVNTTNFIYSNINRYITLLYILFLNPRTSLIIFR